MSPNNRGPNQNHPYSLISIDNKPSTISDVSQNVGFTSYNKVKSIFSDNPDHDPSLSILYGNNHERIMQVITKSDQILSSKIYVGGIYEEVFDGTETKQIHYLIGGSGLASIVTKHENGSLETWYIHKDHIGSIQCITNESGEILEEYSYDAWGTYRDPETWQIYDTPPEVLTDFGFTGHEHIRLFSLVNMTGRIYDPIIGRFLSVDPIMPGNNSFSGLATYRYCLNNPLSYVDPDGQNPVLLFFAFAAAWMNVVANMNHIENFGDFALATTVGFAAGYAAGFLGSAVAGAFGLSGFFAGSISAGAGYFPSAFLNGVGNAFALGISMPSAEMFFIGGAVSMIAGGLISGISAINNHGNFFTGKGAFKIQYSRALDSHAGDPSNIHSSADIYKAGESIVGPEYSDYVDKVSLGMENVTDKELLALNKLEIELVGDYFKDASGKMNAFTLQWGDVNYTTFTGFSPGSTRYFGDLKSVVGHEFIHAWHWKTGALSQIPGYAHLMTSEYYANYWSSRVTHDALAQQASLQNFMLYSKTLESLGIRKMLNFSTMFPPFLKL